jgi:hypothetical protein
VTRLNEPAQILWNRTEPSGNWIAFDFEGSKSNRDGIGAWVELTTEEGKQWDRVAGWSGYGCASSRTLHFGLGLATRVKNVRVEWPSGAVTELRDLEAGRVVRIRE